jgi:tetratricopeptide (TPR) repeat protein
MKRKNRIASVPMGISWRWMAALALGLGLLTLATYANSFSAGLVLDNGVLIGQDTRLQGWSWDNIELIFTRNYWWPYLESDLYRPLTTLSYWFNYTALGGGKNVVGYHVVNFLLHWANAWLVLVIVRRLTGRLGLAALTAALFVVHPVNVESVTNIVGRADLLATLAILFGGWCYMRAAAAEGRRKVGWLSGMGLSALVGVLTKESAVMICAFVLLYDWIWRWPAVPGRTLVERLRGAAWEFGMKGYVALAPALGLLWGIRRWMTYNTPVFDQRFVDNPIAHPATWWAGFLTAMKVLGRYLVMLVWPQTLSCDYSYNQIPLYGEGGGWWEDAQCWLGLGLVAAILWAATRRRRSNPTFAWGTWFFFLMLLPTANVVMPIGSIMAERFLYLPSAGFCMVAAQGLMWLGERIGRGAGEARWRAAAAWVLPVLVLAGLAGRTYARNADWHDELSLWKSAVAAAPNSFKVHKGYANALWDAGHSEVAVDGAIAQDEAADAILEQTPLTPERQDNTLYQDMGLYYRLKGILLQQHGQMAEAQVFFQKAVAILERARTVDRWVNQASQEKMLRAGKLAAEIGDVGNHRVYLQLGMACLMAGDNAEAEEAGRYMQHIAPQEAMGYVIAGAGCFNLGRPKEAVAQFFAGLVLDPNNAEAWSDLQHCFAALGEPAAVVSQKGGGYRLDGGSTAVRDGIKAGFVVLVQAFEGAKRPDDAQKVRELAEQKYQLPADTFDTPGS